MSSGILSYLDVNVVLQVVIYLLSRKLPRNLIRMSSYLCIPTEESHVFDYLGLWYPYFLRT
jgi:hypothetical protein